MPMTRRCLVCGDAARQRQLSECKERDNDMSLTQATNQSGKSPCTNIFISICWSILQSCDASSATTLLLLVSLRCHVCENDKAYRWIQRTSVYNTANLFVELDMLLTSLSVPSQRQLYQCKLID